jgi:hypothetical protein
MTEEKMVEIPIPQDYKDKMEKYIDEHPGYESVDELLAEAIRVHMFDLNTKAKLDLTFVDGVNLTNDVYRELLEKWLHDSELEDPKECIKNEAYEILANDVLLDGYYTERTKQLYKKFNIKIE